MSDNIVNPGSLVVGVVDVDSLLKPGFEYDTRDDCLCVGEHWWVGNLSDMEACGGVEWGKVPERGCYYFIARMSQPEFAVFAAETGGIVLCNSL